MPQFLLDEHLSARIVSAVHLIRHDIAVVSLYDWEDGQYVGVADGLILAQAHEQGLTLVTYDMKTISPLLVRWGERGVPHAGVVFGDTRTIPTNDFGGIARALVRLWQEQGDLDWTNHIAYLNRAPERG